MWPVSGLHAGGQAKPGESVDRNQDHDNVDGKRGPRCWTAVKALAHLNNVSGEDVQPYPGCDEWDSFSC